MLKDSHLKWKNLLGNSVEFYHQLSCKNVLMFNKDIVMIRLRDFKY